MLNSSVLSASCPLFPPRNHKIRPESLAHKWRSVSSPLLSVQSCPPEQEFLKAAAFHPASISIPGECRSPCTAFPAAALPSLLCFPPNPLRRLHNSPGLFPLLPDGSARDNSPSEI